MPSLLERVFGRKQELSPTEQAQRRAADRILGAWNNAQTVDVLAEGWKGKVGAYLRIQHLIRHEQPLDPKDEEAFRALGHQFDESFGPYREDLFTKFEELSRQLIEA